MTFLGFLTRSSASFFLLIGGSACQNSEPPWHKDTIDAEQISSAVLHYWTADQPNPLSDSLVIPTDVLHRFIRTWNEGGVQDPRKSRTKFSVHVRFKDHKKRTFRLNGKYAKEKDDWAVILSDTLLETSLDSLREINERWFGQYDTENGATLSLFRNGRYDYSMFQCTHGWSSAGMWSTVADTLRLIADPEPKKSTGPLSGHVEWASFDDPFVRKGGILYFTVGGDLNHRYFFTKK